MNYQGRIREIQSAFIMGFQDRETCIGMFEELLHDYGLLPKEDHLDRTITNENFLQLLKAAKEHKSGPKLTQPNTTEQSERTKRAEENLRKFSKWMEQMNSSMNQGMEPRYKIADSVKQRCPVCQKIVGPNSLFNRAQSLDNQIIPVDPPRCQECMVKWIEERFGASARSKVAEPHTITVDRSPASPMSPSEADFFAEYEKQMTEPTT